MSSLKYIPKHKRRQQADRLHGAFSGGFSAGYFNTVGSREGWQPRQQNDETTQQVQDFMDEQDHTDWGGPRRVRQDLSAGDGDVSEPTKPPSKQNESSDLLHVAMSSSSQAVVPPKNVGQRLLRQLGWRGGDSTSAYVPLPAPPQTRITTRTSQAAAHSTSTHRDDEQIFLSERRLRKIQIQQKRIHIPPPKLDVVGLGFEAQENAPEFKAYFERRKQQQMQRANEQKQQQSSVYRLSSILGGDDEDEPTQVSNGARENLSDEGLNDSYAAYETEQDFVGTKSASGFALREDDDDAFEDTKPLVKVTDKVHIDQEQYDTVIQDHVDSDVEDDLALPPQPPSVAGKRDEQKKQGQKPPLGGALAAWAAYGTDKQRREKEQTTRSTKRMTSDGRPMLSGFVSALESHESSVLNKRFRGPDLPVNYSIRLHEFGPNESPMVLQTLTRATQLEREDARRQALMDQTLAAAVVKSKRAPTNTAAIPQTKTTQTGVPVKPRVATIAFQGLAQAMRNRFTTSSSVGDSNKDSDTAKAENTSAPATKESPKRLTITRTVHTFVPTPLLCKRFGVPVPKHAVNSTQEATDTRRPEEKYFEDNILKVATEAARQSQSQADPSGHSTTAQRPSQPPSDQAQDTEEDSKVERPSMDVYRSIFNNGGDDDDDSAASDSSNSKINASQENTKIVESKQQGESRGEQMASSTTAVGQEESLVKADEGDEDEKPRHRAHRARSSDSSMDSSEAEKRRKRKKKRKKQKYERREKDDDDDGDDDEEGSLHRRKKRHRKDKKRHSKKRKRPSRDATSD